MKLSDKLITILENSKIDSKIKKEEKIDETVLRVIRELSENNWYMGRKTRVFAAKKIHQIAESKDKKARQFMKALNKAAKLIALHLEKK